jgi:hypothetical protein
VSNRGSYVGEELNHARLLRRQSEVRARHEAALQRVEKMSATQQTLGRELGEGLQSLADSRETLQSMERAASEASLFAALVRPFTARRTATARRSVTEALLARHERVSVHLREATAFADELKLTSLELQQEVDRLHREAGEALHNQREAASRIVATERALRGLESQDLPPEQRARHRDRLDFDLRTEAVALDLFEAAAQHASSHLPAARSLRDTVLQLHEQMAKFVLDATHTVNAAGRRIHGLGVLADAPVVVAELRESLEELQQAMDAAQAYVASSQALITQVLPELSAQAQARAEASSTILHAELEQVDRERARLAAERALRESAEREIQDLLGHPRGPHR